MARLHTRKRGKSGRKRPKIKVLPEWAKHIDKNEIAEKVKELARKGTPLALIGQIMRDQYGVPSLKALFGMSLKKWLEKEGIKQQYPEDLLNLIKKAVRMREHLKEHKKDIHNRVRLQRVESKIWRLVKYYKRRGVLPADWKYDPETAALLVK